MARLLAVAAGSHRRWQWPRPFWVLVALQGLAVGEAMSMAQDLNLCLLGGNNLGGKGPDFASHPAGIRYKNVALQGMKAVDLVILSQGAYVPQDPARNGNSGEGKQIGDISVQAGSKADLVFKFVATDTMDPVALDFYFTLFLTSPGERLGLKGPLQGFQKYCLAGDSILRAEAAEDAGGMELRSTSAAQQLEPRDPYTLERKEKDQAVTLFFHASEFSVSADFSGAWGNGGPRFMFSGTAPLQDHCTPWEGGKHLAKAHSSHDGATASSTRTTTTGTTTSGTTTTTGTTTTGTTTPGVTTKGTTTTITTRTRTTTTATTATSTSTITTTTATATATTATTTATSTRTTTGTTATATTVTHTTSTWDECLSHDTTTPDPFNCHEGYSNWAHEWSYEQRSFCCERCARGCKLVFPLTTTEATRAPFDCGSDDGPPLTDAEIGDWSEEHRSYCCPRLTRGCAEWPKEAKVEIQSPPRNVPAASAESLLESPTLATRAPQKSFTLTSPPQVAAPYNCRGPSEGWHWRRKAWCCEHYSRGCLLATTPTAAPYDCQAGLSNWRAGWSGAKQSWCCRTHSLGCADTTTRFSDEYDCQAGFQRWEAGWSYSKKLWCCQHYNRGCHAGSTSTEPYDCMTHLEQWQVWTYRKRDWCCKNKHLGCGAASPPTQEPFDCAAGFSMWQEAWNIQKRRYCCAQYNRGCTTIGSERKFERLRHGASQGDHSPYAPVGISGTFYMVACGMCIAAGLAALAAIQRAGRRREREELMRGPEADPMLPVE